MYAPLAYECELGPWADGRKILFDFQSFICSAGYFTYNMGDVGFSHTEDSAQLQYVSGKYVKDDVIENRAYQTELVDGAESHSTLVALPTGTGKTAVAVRLAARRLASTSGMVLMLAPTQPLVNQHAAFFREALTIPDHEIEVFTGDVRPDERAELWSGATSVVIATPQVIENDLIGNRYTLEDVCYVVFDECHRATGNYAYNYIGERYHGNATNPLATGLSASPGASKDSILEVCSNLGLTNVEVLTEEDKLLQDHLHETSIDERWVNVPEPLIEARDLVQEVYVERLQALKKDFRVLDSARKDLPIRELMRARGKIQRLIDNGESRGFKAQSVHAEALKISHGWRTVETQSPEAAISYFEQIIEEGRSSSGSRAAERISSSPRIKHAMSKLREFDEIHPKLRELHTEVAMTLMNGGQVLIFTESRKTASAIVEHLDDDKIDPVRFVGQNNKKNDAGMTQTEQKETLDKFRGGEYNVLVSTSVAEEGIDIPAVDLVLFYEPVPNAIRTVQRRGRTGRETTGRVVLLIAKDTGDETAYYVSKRRETKMKEQLNTLKEMEDELRDELREEQASLTEFGERFTNADQPVVFIDSRETKSAIGKHLDRMSGITVNLGTFDVGDYIVSDRVAVERKELDDFISSLVGSEGRDMFDQIKELSDNYSRPVLLVEGGQGIEGLYERAQVSEEAIRSTVQSIAIDFGVSLIFTLSEEETAKNIRSLARREQEDNGREVNPHGKKATDSLEDIQIYVVSSIPGVGPVTARELLGEFGSVRGIMTASVTELTEVEGVGDRIAEQIVEVGTATFSE